MGPNTMRKAVAIVASSLLLAGLASCGKSPEQAPAGATLPTQAELDSLKGDRLKLAARDASRYEFYLHYKIMQTTGMVEALGGEQQAIAALGAVSTGFERSALTAQTDVPRMIPAAAFDGNGFDAGVMGVGYGLFGGLVTTGMLGSLSHDDVTSLASKGPLKFDHTDGSAELGITQAGIDTALDQKIDEHGMTGRVKTRIHLDACPDADGKLTVTIETESQMSAGGKSGTVKMTYHRERWLDDDANLTDEAAEEFQNEMTGDAGAGGKLSLAERYTTGRDGQMTGGVTSQQGFDIFHIEDARHTEQLRTGTLNMLRLLADVMLLGFTSDPPYKSGRCIDLQVRADPAKRTGARPNTAYTLFANPRARLDGAPAGGTVTATLDGDSTLNPTTKVRADARFDYANPTRKEQSATVAFESRSKRGVGRATLVFDTKEARAYRIVAGPYTFTTCDITKPFSYSPGAGATLSFTPAAADGRSGSMAFRFTGGGVVTSSYSYTLTGPEEQMSGTMRSTSPTRATAGLSRSYNVQPQTLSSTWTRIEACTGQ